MSFSFGGGSNPYSGKNPYGANNNAPKDDVFVKPKKEFNFEIKKTIDDISLFDITTENELNDRGRKLTSEDVFGYIEPLMDGPKWLGLTGKGTFGDEPELMRTSFLIPPPKATDKEGNPTQPKDNGNDWNWNTFA